MPNVLVSLAAFAACLLVSSMALVSGAAVSVSATRVSPRVTEEVPETRGVVTVPVERVAREGRVDVVVRRRILGVIPWRAHRLEDVVDAGTSSGRTDVRRGSGRITGSYGTEALTLRTRAGVEWRSESASGLVGSDPAAVAERLRTFIDGGAGRELRAWWAPWLQNAVGVPSALVTLLVLLALARTAYDRVAR